MNLQNQPPVFVPPEHWREIEKLSKAALMDLIWDSIVMRTGFENNADIINEFRKHAGIILMHRKHNR